MMALRKFREKQITRLTGRSFNRHVLSVRERANVRRANLKIGLVFRCKFFDKLRVGIARSSSQLMIQVANDQPFVTETNQPVQQRDGIASAGNTNEVTMVPRKFPQCLRFKPNGATPHY